MIIDKVTKDLNIVGSIYHPKKNLCSYKTEMIAVCRANSSHDIFVQDSSGEETFSIANTSNLENNLINRIVLYRLVRKKQPTKFVQNCH